MDLKDALMSSEVFSQSVDFVQNKQNLTKFTEICL